MKNKKSVLMTLNHNCGCFSTVAGIAGNGSGISDVADLQHHSRYEEPKLN